MRQFLRPFLVVLAVTFPAGAMAHQEMLEGSEWGVVGDPETGGRFISFAGQGRVFGFGGCNRIMGKFEQHDEHLTISNMASTRIACAPEIMAKEAEFLEVLGKVRGAKVDHTLLLLLDENGADLKTLIRRSAPVPEENTEN